MATVQNIVLSGTALYGLDSSGNQDAADMVGLIAAFGMVSPPTGWIICEGQSLNSSSSTEYAALFAKIGTTWGGSGATAFNLPDLRGVFLRSWSNGGTNDNQSAARTGGDNVGSSRTDKGQDEYQQLRGARNGGPAVSLQLDQGPIYGGSTSYASMTVSHFNGYRHTHNTTAWNYHQLPTFGKIQQGQGSEVRPINANVMYCIKF